MDRSALPLCYELDYREQLYLFGQNGGKSWPIMLNDPQRVEFVMPLRGGV